MNDKSSFTGGLYLSRDMTKPTKCVYAQRRLRSAWASAQSDQSLRCPHEETLGPKLPIERTERTLIRLGGCPGWSESSLGVHSFCWFWNVVAHLDTKCQLLTKRYTTQQISWMWCCVTVSCICLTPSLRTQFNPHLPNELIHHLYFIIFILFLLANSEDPDQTPNFDLGLHCLH